ncbi:MAG: serine hydrolase [Promethearchaeota archaeon]
MKKKTHAFIIISLFVMGTVGIAGFFLNQEIQIRNLENKIMAVFSAQSAADLDELFNAGFKENVSPETVFSIIYEIRECYGQLESVLVTLPSGLLGISTYEVLTEKAIISGIINLDNKGKISGFFISKFEYLRDYLLNLSWDAIYNELEEFPGNKSVLIVNNTQVLYSYKPDLRLEVGSLFKLYVLKALERYIAENVDVHWNTMIPINDRWKSLPSGILQNEDNGTLFTLKQYADYMINISDNTATDHIINFITRDYVETFLPAMFDLPLLKTADVFKLRYLLAEVNLSLYLKMNVTQKRNYLDTTVYNLNISEINVEEINWTGKINQTMIEWSFNVTEIFDILNATKNLPSIQMNSGLADPEEWKKVSFKGGSDIGVYSLAHAMQIEGVGEGVGEEEGDWYYCILIINNYLDFTIGMCFSAIAQKIIDKLTLELKSD